MNRYSFEGGEPLITAAVCVCHEGGDAGEVCYRPGEIHDMGDNPDFAGGDPWVDHWMRREPDEDEEDAETPPAPPAAPAPPASAPAPAAQPPPASAPAAPAPAPSTEGA